MSSLTSNLSRRSVLGAAAAGTTVAAGAVVLGPAPAASAATADQIRNAQKRLNDQGYWCGTADGTLDDLTTCAVLAYQKANGWTADGVLDYEVMNALTTVRARPHFTSSGKVLEVDVKRQLLRVVSSGTVVATLHATTGNGADGRYAGHDTSALTPRGRFHIRGSESGTVTRSLGTTYRPHYFLGQYAIYGSSNLANVRGPSTTGGIAVHSASVDLLAGLGHLTSGRAVLIG